MNRSFVDIHCHVLPGLDDGATYEQAALAMARLAVSEGIDTIVATPHQLGNYAANRGATIRKAAAAFQARLDAEDVPLRVLPGADVRIEDGMLAKLQSGDVLTLADRRKHVLLELPHELYFPLEPLLAQLAGAGLVGILSHPERNEGILRHPALVAPLVDQGCLMQVTAGSLVGRFGPASQRLAEQLLAGGLVHFLATDAHGLRSRPPLMQQAFQRAAELAGEQIAEQICCENPRRVAEGREVTPGRLVARAERGLWRRLFSPLTAERSATLSRGKVA